MSIALLILWGAVGWCGTPWPRKLPIPPTPDPWWLVDRLVGIVGGIVGGWLFTRAWPITETGEFVALSVAASAVGAFVTAVILLDIYYSFVPMRQKVMLSASEQHTVGQSGD